MFRWHYRWGQGIGLKSHEGWVRSWYHKHASRTSAARWHVVIEATCCQNSKPINVAFANCSGNCQPGLPTSHSRDATFVRMIKHMCENTPWRQKEENEADRNTHRCRTNKRQSTKLGESTVSHSPQTQRNYLLIQPNFNSVLVKWQCHRHQWGKFRGLLTLSQTRAFQEDREKQRSGQADRQKYI